MNDNNFEKVDRNYAVVSMFKEGYRVTAIVKKFGISRARVYQILDREKKREEKKNGR